MNTWSSIALVILFAFGAAQPALAQAKEPPVAKNWKDSKEALSKLAEKFRDPKLTKTQKVEFLPASNNLLYDTQELKLTPTEKAEQIKVIVNFIAATIEADFANSNTDSVYDDFKSNKKAYLAEIAKLKDKKTKDEILEAFDEWAQVEKKAQKPDEEEGATESETEQ